MNFSSAEACFWKFKNQARVLPIPEVYGTLGACVRRLCRRGAWTEINYLDRLDLRAKGKK